MVVKFTGLIKPLRLSQSGLLARWGRSHQGEGTPRCSKEVQGGGLLRPRHLALLL